MTSFNLFGYVLNKSKYKYRSGLNPFRIISRIEQYKIAEQSSMLLNKHYFMFMLPVFFGSIIAMFYNYSINAVYSYGWIAVKYCGVISIIFIIVQAMFVKIYTSAYSKGLLKEILALLWEIR